LFSEASSPKVHDAGRHRPYFRLERTERPEDMRTIDPFRSVRPHLENSILGTTRWTLLTLGYGYGFAMAQGRLDLEPLPRALSAT
jgi:hypothetical protein